MEIIILTLFILLTIINTGAIIIFIFLFFNLYEKIKRITPEAINNLNSKKEFLSNPSKIKLDNNISSFELSTPDKIWKWLKKDFLMKIGALFILLSLSWFVRYSFLNNWIDPLGRISLGLLLSSGLLIFGFLQISKRRIVGEVITIIGTTGILLTVFAARLVYLDQFFTPIVAFSLMAFTIILSGIIAVKEKSYPIALFSLIAGNIVPLLVKSPAPNELGVLSYLVLLNLGNLFTIWFKGWRSLAIPAMIFVSIYSAVTFNTGNLNQTFTNLFILIFSTIFLANTLSAIYREKTIKISDYLSASINFIILLIWTISYIPDSFQSLTLLSSALVAVVIAFYLGNSKLPKEIVYIYSTASLILIGSATAIELSGSTLAIAFTIEALGAVIISSLVLQKPGAGVASSYLFIIPIIAALRHTDQYLWNEENNTLFNEHFFVISSLLLGLGLTIFLINKLLKKNEEFTKNSTLATIIPHLVIFLLFTIRFIWLCAHNLAYNFKIEESGARGVSLVIYTLLSLGMLFYSNSKQKNNLKILSFIMMGGVIARLLLVEVWEMSIAKKIITFICIGILLIYTAFWQKKEN